MPLTNFLIGLDLAGYEIESLLGRGGTSEVYRARHIRLGREVALKVLPPPLASSQAVRDRFLRESRLAASLEHPHIVPIYEAGEADGLLYIAMRLVEGIDLQSLLQTSGPLSLTRTTRIVSQVASALDAAHRHKVIHRDVKPANILIEGRGARARDEHAYLSDFGLTKAIGSESRFTTTGQIVGSVHYMAPEQIEGKEFSETTDVYSLGCVLFQCLTGLVPYERDSDLAMLWAHVNAEVPQITSFRPDLPARLDHIIVSAIAKKAEDRYASCGDLAKELRRATHRRSKTLLPNPTSSGPGSGTTGDAQTSKRSAERGKSVTFRPLRTLISVVLVVALAGSGLVGLAGLRDKSQGKDVAVQDEKDAVEGNARTSNSSTRPEASKNRRRVVSHGSLDFSSVTVKGQNQIAAESLPLKVTPNQPQPRVSRVVTEDFTPLSLTRTSWSDCQAGDAAGCVDFVSEDRERLIDVVVVDRQSRGVHVWVRQDVDGDYRPDGEWYEFCDRTAAPIRIVPGAIVNVMLMTGTNSSCPSQGPPTGGEIRVTFYNRR